MNAAKKPAIPRVDARIYYTLSASSSPCRHGRQVRYEAATGQRRASSLGDSRGGIRCFDWPGRVEVLAGYFISVPHIYYLFHITHMPILVPQCHGPLYHEPRSSSPEVVFQPAACAEDITLISATRCARSLSRARRHRAPSMRSCRASTHSRARLPAGLS